MVVILFLMLKLDIISSLTKLSHNIVASQVEIPKLMIECCFHFIFRLQQHCGSTQVVIVPEHKWCGSGNRVMLCYNRLVSYYQYTLQEGDAMSIDILMTLLCFSVKLKELSMDQQCCITILHCIYIILHAHIHTHITHM